MTQSRRNLIVPVVMICIGVAIAIWTFWSLREVFRLNSFASTTGTVLNTEVVARRSKSGPHFEPIMRYRYSVAGREYIGDRIWITTSTTRSESIARKFIAGLESNPPLTVWYDPQQPEHAVLSKAYEGWTFGCPLTAAALIILSSAVVVVVQRVFANRGNAECRAMCDVSRL